MTQIVDFVDCCSIDRFIVSKSSVRANGM